MDETLPDIDGLSAVADATWRELGQRLHESGLDGRYLRRIWPSGLRTYERLQTAARLWAARRRQDLATYAYRAFILRDPIADGQAAALLGSHLLDRLVDAGLLTQPATGQVVSRFDCRFFMGATILCDDLAHQGDAVFGAGPGTEAFNGLSRRRLKVARALDVGCGAGGAALWLARHAGHAVASDINPRALQFVRINAAINGVRNVETRLGDLFDTVRGETFDLIISQPPFVPTPPGTRLARYRNGGPVGTELVRRVLAGLGAQLTADGRGVIVLEHPILHSEIDAPTNGPTGFETDPDLQALLIMGSPVHADEYSIRHASQDLRRGIAAFDAAVTEMRGHLARMGIAGIRPSILVVKKPAGASGWNETIDAGGMLWDEVADSTLDRLFEGYALLHRGSPAAQRPPIRIPGDSAVLHRTRADGATAGTVYLVLPAGHLFQSLQFAEEEWAHIADSQRQEGAELPDELAVRLLRAGLLDV
jgi:SAM-dependent methyltransferase